MTGARAALIRRRETEEDVFRRDVVPDPLRRDIAAPAAAAAG